MEVFASCGVGFKCIQVEEVQHMNAHTEARTITSSPLPGFGVEVRLDLSLPIDEPTREALRQLRATHHLMVFRGQNLSFEQQKDLMSTFGPLLESFGDGFGYVSNDRADGQLGSGELHFHSDLDFSPLGAYYMISLQAIEVANGATSTVFANCVHAFERLPAEIRDKIYGLDAFDVASPHAGGLKLNTEQPKCVHPVVRHVPVTGRPALFVSKCTTDRILGLSYDESSELLEALWDCLYDPIHLYEQHWHVGDLVVWDNRACQHRRDAFDPNVPRTLQRVTCAEPHSGFYDAFPQFSRDDFGSQYEGGDLSVGA